MDWEYCRERRGEWELFLGIGSVNVDWEYSRERRGAKRKWAKDLFRMNSYIIRLTPHTSLVDLGPHKHSTSYGGKRERRVVHKCGCGCAENPYGYLTRAGCSLPTEHNLTGHRSIVPYLLTAYGSCEVTQKKKKDTAPSHVTLYPGQSLVNPY